jgi:hypothetical protein
MSDQQFEPPRAAPRVDIRLPARLHTDHSVVDVETVNLSTDGLLVRGDNLDADAVHIEIDLHDMGWQRLPTQVVRTSHDGEQLAAKFADAASSGSRDAIQAFLKRYLG